MKKIINIFLIVAFIAAMPVALKAQVVMKEFLSQNHEGKIENSKNNFGKSLYYKLEYKSTDGARIYYTLNFYKDANMNSAFLSLPVLMRNLTWTYYMDISMEKDGMTKVFAMIFKKDLRWARVKYSPHTGCAINDPIVWERLDMVDDFGKLINGTLTQLDKNIKLECYSK